MSKPVIPPHLIHDLADAALEAGLDRRLLLMGLPIGFTSGLHRDTRPATQLILDLDRLNQTPELLNFEGHPLALWLENALRRTHVPRHRELFATARRALMDQIPTQDPDTARRIAKSQAESAPSRNPTAVFLSYASADRSMVDTLFAALERRLGPDRVFQDHRSIRPGQRWFDVLLEALGAAALIVPWVSPNFGASKYAPWELGLAEGRGATPVPIFTDPALIPSQPRYLQDRQGLRPSDPPDFEDLAEQIAELLKSPR